MFEVQGDSSPELFELLTDALRSGPGTPPWAAALKRLGASGKIDDHQLIFTARQRLAEAGPYRAVLPSVRLTRAVLAGVAAQAGAENASRFRWMDRTPGARTLLAISAVAAMLIVSVGVVAMSLMLNDDGFARRNLTLPARTVESGFVPLELTAWAGWRPIGSLRVKSEHGLRLAGGIKQIDQSGGLLQIEPLAAGKPFKLEANVRYLKGASVSPEIFLTDDADFDDDRPAERNHEFVWTVAGDHPVLCLPDRSAASAGDAIAAPQATTLTLAIKVNGPTATVETCTAGHKTLWTGPHQLAMDKPWHLGVRFVIHGARHDDCVAVESLRVAQR